MHRRTIVRLYLHDLHRINRANLLTGIAFDAEVGDNFVLFVRLEQNRFSRAFLRAFGTSNTQIINLIFDQALTFSRWTFAIDVCNIFFSEIS